MNEKQLFTAKEAADYLQYSEVTLELWRREGKGPKFHKPSQKIYYFKSDLDAWIKESGK
jgi:predicted site-specific integrase-resolvase